MHLGLAGPPRDTNFLLHPHLEQDRKRDGEKNFEHFLLIQMSSRAALALKGVSFSTNTAATAAHCARLASDKYINPLSRVSL